MSIVQSTTVWGLDFNVSLASLTNHNTSAFAAYNQANFAANFGTNSWVSQDGTTIAVDPSRMDRSLNPTTPGHVSKVDVHTLIPSRPDLRWFAHITPWFGERSHMPIGLTNNSTDYVAAMLGDIKSRGFNGVIIDWYGQKSSTDQVTRKIQSYLAGIAGNTFTYTIMVDRGTLGKNRALYEGILQTNIEYCQAQYFNDPNYEHEPLSSGLPILMFFGVREAIGDAGMACVKANTGGKMVWVEQDTHDLASAWEDQCFEWTRNFHTGINPRDPFNLTAVTAPYDTIRQSGKQAFGAMCAGFNGTLTRSVGWSMGKYLPANNGLCLVERAARINAAIPTNITRMQWATWNDWEEGTEIETGIENNVALVGQVNGSSILSWRVTDGEPRTLDHYEVYASTDGRNAALVCSVPAGVHQTNLSQLGLAPGSYRFYVDAIGKPCVRDHLSAAISCMISAPKVETPRKQ